MNDAILTMEAADDPLKAEAVPGPCPPAASDPKRPYTVGTLRYCWAAWSRRCCR